MAALLSQANPKALPNPLESYASYNYVLSLSALNRNQVNDPDGTYMAGGETRLICKSGSADPSNRINVDGFGKNDFFITNLELDSMIGFRDGKNTNVITVSFEVYEPYSIGLFLLSCQLAAARSGFPNHHLAPYLLTIEFRGNKESGVMQEVPYTKKYIPIIINSIDVAASESGAKYTVSANVSSSYAQSIIYSKVTKDIQISGKTVQEALQSLETSLQFVINQQKKEGINRDKTGTNNEPDQILIIFPKNITSPLKNLGSTKGATFSKADSVTEAKSVFQKLGTVEKTLANAPNQVQMGEMNSIAEASLNFGNLRKGDSSTALYDKVFKQKAMNRSSVTLDDTTGTFRFAQGTNITSIINEIILNSEYVVKSLSEQGIDDYGNRKWWRVETQTYYLNDNRLETNNIPATLTVYRILEYLCHTSIITGPGLKPIGIDKVNENVPKIYNYMYSGNDKAGSTEVMKFDISYKFGWFSSFLADKGNLSQDTARQEQKSAGDDGKTDSKREMNPTAPGSKRYAGASVGPGYPDIVTNSTTGNTGGAEADTEQIRIARQFQALISNPLEMIGLDMEIHGDPFWISSSGMGNYISPVTKNSFINSDYSVNFQTGEVYIHVNFKSPIDINQATGLYTFPKVAGAYDSAIMFKGVYRVNTVTSIFRDGVFKQVIKGYRVNNQYEDQKAEKNQTLNNSSSYWGESPKIVK